MKASREHIIKAIDNVTRQIIDNSVRVDAVIRKNYGRDKIKLTMYDSWGNVIDYTIGEPYDVLCVAKSWLYPLLH